MFNRPSLLTSLFSQSVSVTTDSVILDDTEDAFTFDRRYTPSKISLNDIKFLITFGSKSCCGMYMQRN